MCALKQRAWQCHGSECFVINNTVPCARSERQLLCVVSWPSCGCCRVCSCLDLQTRNRFEGTRSEVESLMKKMKENPHEHKNISPYTMEGYLYVQEKRRCSGQCGGGGWGTLRAGIWGTKANVSECRRWEGTGPVAGLSWHESVSVLGWSLLPLSPE